MSPVDTRAQREGDLLKPTGVLWRLRIESKAKEFRTKKGQVVLLTWPFFVCAV
jgi:hypothetical protein